MPRAPLSLAKMRYNAAAASDSGEYMEQG